MWDDPIRPAIWIGGIATIIGLLTLSYVAFANLSSRNIGLGLGAFVGACVIFALQLYFDLQATATTENIAADVIVDWQSQAIRLNTSQPMYARSIFIAGEASKLLPKSDNGPDRPTATIKLSRDFVMLALINYLLNEQPDWQMTRASYRTSMGTMSTWQMSSAPSECTTVDLVAIKQRLTDVNNSYANVQQISFLSRGLCLPPHSKLEIKESEIIITTRICKITLLVIDGFAMHSSTLPGASREIELLPDGSPRYGTTTLQLRATIEYFSLRAQDRYIAKYRDWANRVVAGAKEWLEGPAI
jgi:hypothetical protein